MDTKGKKWRKSLVQIHWCIIWLLNIECMNVTQHYKGRRGWTKSKKTWPKIDFFKNQYSVELQTYNVSHTNLSIPPKLLPQNGNLSQDHTYSSIDFNFAVLSISESLINLVCMRRWLEYESTLCPWEDCGYQRVFLPNVFVSLDLQTNVPIQQPFKRQGYQW